MKYPRDLTGMIFGRLTVINGPIRGGRYISPDGTVGSCVMLWHCRCECGAEKTFPRGSLLQGLSRSCGCLKKVWASKMNYKHGLSNTRPHDIWRTMIDRCTNPNSKIYEWYGGRGITVCERWLGSFESFMDDMGPTYDDRLSLDRYPDQDGNYEKDNCRWATRKEQARNARSNVIIDTPWGRMTITEAGERAGFKRGLLQSRITERGWPAERWFEPIHYRGQNG